MSVEDEDLFEKIKSEFDNVESFVELDGSRTDRFKSYLKRLYDYLKVNEEDVEESTNPSLPELIVDSRLVDTEQVYQQLQLYNKDASASLGSLAKFFSRCLLAPESVTFNVDTKQRGGASAIATENGTTTDNVDDDSNDGADEDEDEESDAGGHIGADHSDDDDSGAMSDDSVENMLKNSKIKMEIYKKEAELKSKKKKPKAADNFGIPDGSDSEISDFDVNENAEDEDEEDAEEDELEDDGDELDLDEELKPKKKGLKKEINLEDIDSDEVDEDLVDLYTDLGDEKEVLDIGKPSKSFDEIDFDREDFGMDEDDDDDDDDEDDGDDKPAPKKEKVPKEAVAKTKDLFGVDDDDEDAKADTNGKSSFEIRQEKLKEQIDEIHKTMLGEVSDKPWQLKGEVTSRTRPKESLLEEYVEFDHTTRQAPIISVKTTEDIEAMIKRRVKDKAFDDVERKVKPVEMQYEYKKLTALDQEKSKVSLGDVYEQDFLKQQEKAEGLLSGDKTKEVVNPKHEEIRKQMQKLFIKLDALSNFHYTPRAPAPEIKVISNMPSIAMEEVAPVSVADSNALAPEEIRPNIKSLPKSKSEEDKTDKKRNMRLKKSKIKKVKEGKEKRLKTAQALDPDNPKLSKEIAMNKLKKQAKNMSKNLKILKPDKNVKVNSAYRSSAAFFKQLQETAQIGNRVVKKKKLNDSKNISSKKLKL